MSRCTIEHLSAPVKSEDGESSHAIRFRLPVPHSRTNPNGLIGPNVTHFGSRDLIAGGVLPNDSAHLAEWLRNPQEVKPGSDMPDLGLSQDQINALVAYLESLK